MRTAVRHEGAMMRRQLGLRRGWHRYVGDAGNVLSMDRFGAYAPGNEIQDDPDPAE